MIFSIYVQSEYADLRFGQASSMAHLVLPIVQGERRRIIYTISEYEPLLDSSNMSFSDWERIAVDIRVRLTFAINFGFEISNLNYFLLFSNRTNFSTVL